MICSIPYGNGRRMLTKDFTFVHKAVVYNIPKGFIWDGASIPKGFRWLIGKPFSKEFSEASLIHDWNYTTHKFSRLEADELLYEYLIHNKTPKWKAQIMLSAVRQFGSAAWRNTMEDLDDIDNLIDYIFDHEMNWLAYDFGMYNKLLVEEDFIRHGGLVFSEYEEHGSI